jgi:hypothetical protein
MAISIRRVDLTQETLNEPVPPPAPGQAAAQFGPTAALNLLTALSDLRNTQNNFMSVWLNYEATRLSLLRDLGIMVLDENGRWIDLPIDQIDYATEEEHPLPPSVPFEWLYENLPPIEPGAGPAESIPPGVPRESHRRQPTEAVNISYEERQ